MVREGEPLAVGLARVGALVRRAPVTCSPDATVREAAGLMTEERVSAPLVPTAQGVGILTDRDFRSRVLAAGAAAEALAGRS